VKATVTCLHGGKQLKIVGAYRADRFYCPSHNAGFGLRAKAAALCEAIESRHRAAEFFGSFLVRFIDLVFAIEHDWNTRRLRAQAAASREV